jgi:Phosphotransferase enzyme family
MDIRGDHLAGIVAGGIDVITIRGLIVDDNERWLDLVASRFSREFRKFRWEITWDKTTDLNEGQRLISSVEKPFDLVVADLLFKREDLPDRQEPSGLELISDAKLRSPQTYIVAISVGVEELPDLLVKARRRGAHHALWRSEFSLESIDHSPAAIAGEIRAHLVNNGSVIVCEVIADDLDPAVQSLLHEVGKPTLAGLQQKILEVDRHDAGEIDVRFLAPGASGASVCAITTLIEGSRKVRHVLKLSRAGDRLEREAKRGRQAAEVLPQYLVVQHRPDYPVGPINGWYALGGPLIDPAITLRAWLRTGPSATSIKTVMEKLFVDGLGRIYSDIKSVATEPLGSFTFSYYRQRRILSVLEEIKAALMRPDGGNLTDSTSDLVRDLTAFVTEGRLLDVLARSIPRQTYATYAHGDLHAGNVLVTDVMHPAPLLIDTSEFGLVHWATDPACFAIDLLMSSVDAGVDSMFFAGFDTWRTLICKFGEGSTQLTAVTATGETSAALTALSWLAENLSSVWLAVEADSDQGGHYWEWHAALATYLLRATYHSDIPHPKRALAFVAAHDQLIAAANVMAT